MTEHNDRLAALSPEQRVQLGRLLKQRSKSSAVIRPRTPHTLTAPCSWMQRGLWLLDQLQPGAAYNLGVAVRLGGAFDVECLERALNTVVERHEVLRTTFAAGDGDPIQCIAPGLHIAVTRVDLSLSQPEQQNAEAELRARALVHEPFDLARGPLIRATALRFGRSDWRLILAMHHIITDEWSFGLLFREIEELYDAFRAGRAIRLVEPSLQYADYALWQRTAASQDTLQDQLAYWQHKLADAPVTELASDYPRPVRQRFRGATVPFLVSALVAERLAELGRRERATVFMTVLAAFQTLLHRYTAQDDIVVGTPVADRRQRETENLIGFFLNTLVMRTEVSADLSFRDLLRRVRAVALAAYEHGDLPFELLVQALHPKRDPGRTPLFQIMFTFQDMPAGILELPGLTAEVEFVETGSAQFDLNVISKKTAHGLGGVLQYDTDLFDRTTIERLASNFQTLLASIAADPDRQLSELDVLSRGERQQVVTDWNLTQQPYDLDQTLPGLFQQQVARTPHSVALVFGDQALTYTELDARANQLAHHLHGLGIGPETLVGICAERSVELVVGLLAILKAGGAYVPLDPSYPSERLAFMVDDAQVPVLLTQAHLESTLPRTNARRVRLDADAAEWAHEPTTTPLPGPYAENLAYMIYTSGSTGRPKGALNEHRGILNRLTWMQQTYGLDASDRVLQKTPFSFDVSVWEFFWPLLNGARLVVARPDGHRDPAYLREVIRDQAITTLHFVPSMLQIFLQEPDLLSACATVRRVVCSGEALSPETQAKFFQQLPGVQLHNLYGPTEAAVDVTAWHCQPNPDERSVPIGRPIANTQIYILDADQQPVPIGVPGELYIGGVQVGRGYLNRPELTAERFVRDPFARVPGARLYRTGDLARWRPDGVLEYLGRLDFQVKVRGYRVELGEIESRLLEHPLIKDSIVVARHDRAGDVRLVAYIVPSDGPVPTGDTLRGHLKQRLPDYMVPSAFVVLKEMPLSPNGKLDRRGLPPPEPHAEQSETDYVAPRTATESVLVQIWTQVLGVEQIGIHDNFFDLGGDSILSMQVVARARQSGIELRPGDVFQHETIADLATVARPLLASSNSSPSTATATGRDSATVTLDQQQLDRILAKLGTGKDPQAK